MIKINDNIINKAVYNGLKDHLTKSVLQDAFSNRRNAKRLKTLLSPIFNRKGYLSNLIKDIINFENTNAEFYTKYNIDAYFKMVYFFEKGMNVSNRQQRKDFLSEVYVYSSKNENKGIRKFIPRYLEIRVLDLLTEEIKNDENFKLYLKDFLFKIFLDFTVSCKELFSYSKFITPFRAEIIDAMNIKICPYCNEGLIHKIGDDNQRVLADIDHFHLQSKLPLFSLTFFNFIPSCYVCNRGLKGQSTEEILNPRMEGLGDNALFELKNPILTNNLLEIEVELNIKVPESSREYNLITNSIKLFALKDRYNHDDVKMTLLKLYRESNRLSQGMLDSYNYILDNANDEITFEEIYSYIFEFGVDSTDFINLRYGKLKSDIFNERYFRK